MYASSSTTSTSALMSISLAVTSPGSLLTISSSTASSRSSLNLKSLTLRMMSTTSSLTPGTVENSWLTPSILTFVTAAPSSPESNTLLKELPKVCPRPRGNGSATNLPRLSSSSSTLKRGGAMSNIVKLPPASNVLFVCLPAVELDYELLFDGRVDLVPPRRVQNPACEVVVVSFQPRWHRDDLLDRIHYRLQVPALLPDCDHVPRLQDRRWDVVLAPVQEEVAVHHELPRLRAAGGEAHPEHDVVHPELHEPQEVLAGNALHPGCLVVSAPELLLGDTVVPASLLLLQEPDAVLRLPLPTPPVLPRWVRLLLQGVLAHVGEHHPRPPVAPGLGARVTRHLPLPPKPLRRPATVVRLAGDVPDREHLDTHPLEGAGGHVPTRAVALDLDVHAPHALVHRLVRDALGRHLGRVRGALAASLEAQRTRRFPGYDVTFLVGHADDGVVERALYMHDTGRDVPAHPPARPTAPTRALLSLPAHLPLLPPAYGRLRALTLARVGLGALAAHREPPAVPDTPVRADVYKPSYVLVFLAPEVALDLEVLLHVGADGAGLAVGEVPDLRIRVYIGLFQNLPRRRAPDPVYVRQPDLYPLLAWQVHARYTRHLSPASACDVGSCRSPAPPRAAVSPCTARRWASRSPVPSKLLLPVCQLYLNL